MLSPGLTGAIHIIRIVLIILMVVLSAFMVVIVLLQPGGGDGLEAVSGSQDTFFGKNKGKTTEGAMKKITVITAVSLVVVSILFWVSIIILNDIG